MKAIQKAQTVLLLTLSVLAGCGGEQAKPQAAKPQGTPEPWITRLSAPQLEAAADGLTVVRLANGLTVIIKVNSNAPVVDVRAYVHTGSMYEGRWLGAGLSHLLEHLVAQGASHDMGPGQTAAEEKPKDDPITRLGGQSNAYTTLDHTCYYISANSSKAMECVDLVAQWMSKPQITKEDFQREHEVVQRELEMGKDDPSRQLFYSSAENLYGSHPAGVPTIGYKSPLTAVTYQDVLEYHAASYVPQNMVFVVVGKVDPKSVLERVRKAFDAFPAQRTPDHALAEVQNILSVRRMIVPHVQVREASEMLSFLTIPMFSDDLYALDLLSTVLSEGQSSRLVQRIFRQRKLVTSVDTSSHTPAWGRGSFNVTFRTSPRQADAAEAAILQELRQVADKGIDSQELERAKRQMVAQFVYSQQTVDSQSSSLGTDCMFTGDVEFSRKYVDRIGKVTLQQVQAAARKYFTFGQMAVTRMVPATQAAQMQMMTQTAKVAKPQTFTLPSGLRVVLNPVKGVLPSKGLVSMALVTQGGLMIETPRTNGLGMLMAGLSTKGAGKRSAEEIAAFFDAAGGSISGTCGNNTFTWQATVMDDSADRALEIFADVVERPTYAPAELDILRPAMLAAIERIDAQWQSQMQKFFREQFFTNSPYRMLPSGSPAVVTAATAGQLAQYHRQNVLAGSSVLAVYGQFDPDAFRKKIERLFADLPAGKVELTVPAPRRVSPKGEMHLLPTENEVAAITVAAPGMLIRDLDDRFPIDVLDTIISGWQLPSGWLHEELRGKGLVYVVHATNWPGLAPGAFFAYAACQPPNAREVIAIIQKELDRAARYTPTQAQIDQAVNTILTAEALDNQELSAVALQGALDELFGFGYDFRSKTEARYRSVRPQDVARVGSKYLGKGYVVTVTTPAPKNLEQPKAATQETTQEKDR